MRKLGILLTLSITSFCGYGQTIDTLYANDYRVTADLLYGALNPQYHEGALINRAIELSDPSLNQLFGNYSQIHDTYSWCVMYDDVAISYFDTNEVYTSVSMAKQIENSFTDFDAMDDDELRQPFALLYHELNVIDSSLFNDEYFDVVNHQFVVKNDVDESSLYNKVTLKSASILEFYADNGYEEGRLVYDEKFISTSPNIEINSLLISINNQRFQLFDENNYEIRYSRLQDSVIARVAINFTKQGILQSDTLSFYLTTNSGFSENDFAEKSLISPWDDTYTWKRPEMDFRVAIKYGCGKQEKIM